MQQTRKNVICSVLALLLALTALTALFYNVMYTTSNTLIGWAENGFSMLDFRSDLLSDRWAAGGSVTIACGIFCLLQLIFSFFLLLFSILTLIMPSKAYKLPRAIFTCINELFLLLYAILGILAMTSSFSGTMTAAYIPLLYGTVLLFAYFYCTKRLPEPQNSQTASDNIEK